MYIIIIPNKPFFLYQCFSLHYVIYAMLIILEVMFNVKVAWFKSKMIDIISLIYELPTTENKFGLENVLYAKISYVRNIFLNCMVCF